MFTPKAYKFKYKIHKSIDDNHPPMAGGIVISKQEKKNWISKKSKQFNDNNINNGWGYLDT